MKNYKKMLASFGTAAVVVAPIAVVVSCGSGSNEWIYNKDNNVWVGGPKNSDFQKNIDEVITADDRAWQIANEQAAFFYYEKEQKASINVQRDEFLWEVHNKKEEKKKLVNNKANEDKINEIQEEIDDINAKINKLNGKLDYSVSDFSIDFPKISLTIEEIRKKQTDVYKNEKDAFVKNYPTRQEGEAAWVTELANKYQGADNDKEAIENLVYGVIKNQAFLRNNISINTSYTVKQIKWANTSGSDGGKDNNAFPFLQIDSYDVNKSVAENITTAATNLKDPFFRVTGDSNDDNAYFYETTSNLWGHSGEENLKVVNKTRIDEVLKGSTDLRMYRHALINIQPNKSDRTLPWTASVDVIKNLFAFTPNSTAGNTKYQFNRITNLWKDMDNFDSTVDSTDDSKETGYFIQQVAGNSESTKKIGGSLGINKTSHWSDKMFDGFALGALLLENKLTNKATGATNITGTDDDIYSKLANAIKDAREEILKLNGGTPTNITTNEQQNAWIDNLNQEQVKNIFGAHMRDLFDPEAMKDSDRGKTGRTLVYTDKVSNNDKEDRFAFISTADKGGVHLIKRYVVDGTTLSQYAITELEKMVKNEDISEKEFNVVGLLSPILIQDKVVKKLITPPTSTTNSDYDDFKKLIKDKIVSEEIDINNIDGVNNATDFLQKAQEYIDNQSRIKADKIASAITNAHYQYLLDALNKKEIAYKDYASGSAITIDQDQILTPEEIYAAAYEIGKKESGV